MPTKPFTKDSLSLSKTQFSLITPEFKEEIAEILTFGAEKYGRENWRKCKTKDLHLYIDAFERHVNAWRKGEQVDQESGKHHLAHAACNLMFLFELGGTNDN